MLVFSQNRVQLNFHNYIYIKIYGFMRKVNLRNVDPAIDDPDASTWCSLFLSHYF
jgi:hypothetical protein